MATIAAPVDQRDQRIVLHGIRWETYESLLADDTDRNAPRLTYDQGTLEIMSPGKSHERDNRALSLIVWTVATEHGINFDDVGSMTYKQATVQRGFEADSTFYLLDPDTDLADEIEGNEDRPPDLVIEIDYSRSSLQKLNLYASLNISEVWRWDGARAVFYHLEAGQYQEIERSRMVPVLTPTVVTEFVLSNRSMTKAQWLRSVRDWARSL